jgi:GNAT superfamily N-acetyltransferase
MTTTYRTAGRDDAEAIERIFGTSFCDTFAHLYRAEDLEAFLAQFTAERWRAELADPESVVRLAEVDGRPVGYVKLAPLKLPVDPGGPSIELNQLYVLSEHHGAGIAKELMDWALGEAKRRGTQWLYLTVFVDNHRARRFYDRYGFAAVGRYEFMVGRHADEDIIMVKAL